MRTRWAARARGRTAREIIPGLEDWWVETLDELVRTGEPRRIEREVPSLGRWYEVQAYPKGGDRFAALFDDVTERKRAEAVLREIYARDCETLRGLVAPEVIYWKSARA